MEIFLLLLGICVIVGIFKIGYNIGVDEEQKRVQESLSDRFLPCFIGKGDFSYFKFRTVKFSEIDSCESYSTVLIDKATLITLLAKASFIGDIQEEELKNEEKELLGKWASLNFD